MKSPPDHTIGGVATTDKLALLKEVYTTLYYSVETFSEGSLGEDIAYLLGAIITDSYCDWDEDRDIVALLNEHFHARHSVWNYIKVEKVLASQSTDEQPTAQ